MVTTETKPTHLLLLSHHQGSEALCVCKKNVCVWVYLKDFWGIKVSGLFDVLLLLTLSHTRTHTQTHTHTHPGRTPCMSPIIPQYCKTKRQGAKGKKREKVKDRERVMRDRERSRGEGEQREYKDKIKRKDRIERQNRAREKRDRAGLCTRSRL